MKLKSKSLSIGRCNMQNEKFPFCDGFVWTARVQNIDHLVHEPHLWTRSMDRAYQNIDRVLGTPFMRLVHGPLTFTTPKTTVVNNNKIKIK